MKYSGKNTGKNAQQILFHWEDMEMILPVDHPLVKKEGMIPWEELIEVIGRQYSLRGTKSKSIRMMLGLELAKRELGISDEKVVAMLSTDIALQYFCGMRSFGEEDIPDPSSMKYFRKRLDTETMREIESIVTKALVPYLPRRRRGQVIVDTTCMEANVTFPTDTKLLKKTWLKLVGVAEEIRENGKDIVIRGKQKLLKEIRGFDLQRKKGKKLIQKMRKKVWREVRKLEKKIMKVIEKKANTTKKTLKETIEGLGKKTKATIKTAQKIIAQQGEMIREKTHSVKDRIVSFHEPTVRPIVRGKEGKNVEFGSKAGISVIGGFLGVSHNLSSDNYSDTDIIKDTLKRYEEIRGKPPIEMVGDRGFHSPGNHDLLQEKGIRDGLEYRGKIPKKRQVALPDKKTRKRMKNQRSVVEGRIGNLKRMGRRCKYRAENMQTWISTGLIMMNLRWAAQKI
jgi:IS5 family transposase